MAAPAYHTRVLATRRAGAGSDSDAIVACLDVDEHAPAPRPAPGQLLVRITARPIHPADIMAIQARAACMWLWTFQRIASQCYAMPWHPHECTDAAHPPPQGTYPSAAKASLPAVPGYEGAGVVEDANGVAGWAAGARVHIFCDPSTGQGSWQQLVAVPPAALSRVPDGMSDAVAAQCRGNPATALGLLEELAPPPGAWVIQTAAASTLGRMLVSLAKQRGVHTINVIRTRAGREHQVKALNELGADAVLAADTDDIASRVRELTGGQMAWGGADAVGGDMTARITAAVRDRGAVMLYGALAGGAYTGSVLDTLGRYVTVKGASRVMRMRMRML
jgi:NADPH:quinone reductase-like Zn-dependent oxidoreductase